MNITQARKIRRDNRCGYFRFKATEMTERCPRCAADITTTVAAWATDRERATERDRTMIEHLMEHQ